MKYLVLLVEVNMFLVLLVIFLLLRLIVLRLISLGRMLVLIEHMLNGIQRRVGSEVLAHFFIMELERIMTILV